MKQSVTATRLGCVLLALALIPAACTPARNYRFEDPEKIAELNAVWAERHDFPPLPKEDYYVPLYAEYLKGLRILLDPGHGGDAHLKGFKRGPTDQREAVMNLRVAESLRGFLEEAGAEVRLTREGDVDVSLADRARMADEWPADLFLSLHHNAAESARANYTTVWFHKDPDHNPASLDLARHVAQGVADALRLPQIAANPLKADTLIYESGFGVLRPLTVTGCLIEASFFTHPYEEYRLTQGAYLRREAWGIFLGLARYAWGGIPDSRLIAPASGGVVESKRPTLAAQLVTGFGDRSGWGASSPLLFWDTVQVRLNGESAAFEADRERGRITLVPPENLRAGTHTMEIRFRNYNGNAAKRRLHRFVVAPPPAAIRLSAADGTLRVQVVDADGDPVLDGTRVHLGASVPMDLPRDLATAAGEATATLRLPPGPGDVRIHAVAGGLGASLELPALPARR